MRNWTQEQSRNYQKVSKDINNKLCKVVLIGVRQAWILLGGIALKIMDNESLRKSSRSFTKVVEARMKWW